MKVSDLYVEELKQYDAGSWYDSAFSGERIPTLKEVLALPYEGTGLMMESKTSRRRLIF